MDEELESDNSDPEDDTGDHNNTDQVEDEFYTPVDSPQPPPLLSDSEESDSEPEISDNVSDDGDDQEDNYTYWNETFHISSTSEEENVNVRTNQDSSSSEDETTMRGRPSQRNPDKNRRCYTPRRASSSPRRDPGIPALGRARSPGKNLSLIHI